MRVTSVVGARPQFVKAAPVSRALEAAGHRERLVHTGQHYDAALSADQFQALGLRAPDVNLNVGAGSIPQQTARMLEGLGALLEAERPDWVLVYGDTTSTLAAALAASQLGVPLVHVEAGLRSFDHRMPEERNRILTDRLSDLLLCPGPSSAAQLRREEVRGRVEVVGDVMLDAVRAYLPRADPAVLARLGLRPKGYALATLHRASNTDDPARLIAWFEALAALEPEVVLPLHPRTRAALERARPEWLDAPPAGLRLIPPVHYVDMLALARDAAHVLTDSGGLQKEAYFLGVPCVTLRRETEWTETVELGWNALAEPEGLAAAVARPVPAERPPLYGDGEAAAAVVAALEQGP
ncbi:MAG: UDP-N-acetylglucosamine 2-epimerase (non-hydrolyzing) [Planctomycetes bacterium]|nr:UDP-N-acetylglucosamine 2-epimerase (non-hydrolyzing) [Planctomycetota bacterium]